MSSPHIIILGLLDSDAGPPVTPPATGSKNSSWADGTQRFVPSARYSRFIWNGRTLDIADPLTSISYEDTPIVGANVTASGKREVLHERDEEVCVLTFEPMVPEIFDRLRRMLREWASRGEQVEVYIDRTLRAYWGFEDGDVFDNNRGNPFRAMGDLTFAELTHGGGVTMPLSGPLQAALVSGLSGGSSNRFLSPDEGTLVLNVRPDYASNDGQEHVWFDAMDPADGGWRNRLTIVKRGNDVSSGNHDDQVIVSYAGANGAETSIPCAHTWAVGDELTVMVQWRQLSDLRVRINDTVYTTRRWPVSPTGFLAGSGLIAGTLSNSPLGAEQIMAASPTRASLGTDDNGLRGRGTGVYGALSLYTVAYGTPDMLKSYAHPLRTYYPKGEFIDATFRPLRSQAGGERYYYTLRIRDGR